MRNANRCTFPFRFFPTEGIGSRAHVTLGYTSGTSAVQTGLDLIGLVQREETCYLDETAGGQAAGRDVVELDDAALCAYDKAQYAVYLNEPIQLSSLFSGRY